MIDPLECWKTLGLPDKPDYAGLLTFGGLPYTQDPADLAGVDVAIVGAPTDDLSPTGRVHSSGHGRFGQRAVPPDRIADLLWATRVIGERVRVVGMDVVEVLPSAVGSADVTALVAERIVREALTGIALRRRGSG